MRTLTIVVASLLFPGGAPGDNAAAKSKEQLQGTWAVVGFEEVGTRATKDDLKDESMSFVFKGDKLTIIKDSKPGEVTFTIDPSKKPATIDLVFTDEKNKGEKVLGIYGLEGDDLKICLNTKFRPTKKDDPRPTEFTTKPGGPGRLLFVLKREKK